MKTKIKKSIAKISLLEWFAYIITFIGFVVIGIFLYHMSSTFEIGGKLSRDEMAATGQVGDFMGGVIGSIVSIQPLFWWFER